MNNHQITHQPSQMAILLFLIMKLSVFLFIPTTSAPDNTNLIYKGCADQKLQPQNLKPLLDSLVSASAQKPFAATTQNALTGAYQCRGDLTDSDCYNCVSRIPSMLGRLCGGADVAAARVQLGGCYLRYEVVGFKEVPATQLLYKLCGARKVVDGGGFEARRDSAFGMVQNGVQSSGNLFYTGSYQSLYVLGQCEGSLGNADCGDCVKSAAEQARDQCADSISAQLYLQKCFLSYSFYPNGVPTDSSSSGGGGGGGGGGHPHTERTVALAVGGVAALGFLVVCLLFLKSVLKKRRGGKY